MDIDRSIENLFLQGVDAEFIAFCRDVESRHPVSSNYSSDAGRWAEFLDCAMIVFSGHKSDTYKDFSMMAMSMKLQEIASNKWIGMSENEDDAAAVIAGRAARTAGPQAPRALMRGAGASIGKSRWLAYLPAAG